MVEGCPQTLLSDNAGVRGRGGLYFEYLGDKLSVVAQQAAGSCSGHRAEAFRGRYDEEAAVEKALRGEVQHAVIQVYMCAFMYV